ncbi:MAG: DUF5678 domain-containing protein [Candidatus Micrarchaeota archaeon]|nr:DUF5678 domain-containing protein [Candidatus Micrarchaeota archaeon]
MADDYSFYLNADFSRYLGQWIAIIDKKVVSHGEDAKQVYDRAKKEFPSKVPFLACVPKSTAMIL